MLAKNGKADAVWHYAPTAREPSAQRTKAPARENANAPAATANQLDELPEFIEPELRAASSIAPPSGPNWGHEIKLDGYRMQMRVEDGKVSAAHAQGPRLDRQVHGDRRGRRDACPIASSTARSPRSTTRACPTSPISRPRSRDGKTDTLVYFVFDLLVRRRRGLAPPAACAPAKRASQTLLAKAGKRIRFVDHVEGHGDAVFEAAQQNEPRGHRLEATRLALSRRAASAPGRNPRSAAARRSSSAAGPKKAIASARSSSASTRAASSDISARVGTGFNQRNIASAARRSLKAAAARITSPFSGPEAAKEKGVRWASQTLVAEVEIRRLHRRRHFAPDRLQRPARRQRRQGRCARNASSNTSIESPPKKPVTVSAQPGERAGARHHDLPSRERALAGKDGDHQARARRLLRSGRRAHHRLHRRPPVLDHPRARRHHAAQLFFQRHAIQGSSKLMTFVKVARRQGALPPARHARRPDRRRADLVGRIASVELPARRTGDTGPLRLRPRPRPRRRRSRRSSKRRRNCTIASPSSASSASARRPAARVSTSSRRSQNRRRSCAGPRRRPSPRKSAARWPQTRRTNT